MARHLKPMQNRLSRVVSGRTVDTPSSIVQEVVMVKALINLSGPDFAIRKGEEMILMNNENPNFWKVKTTFGEREVPSLVFTTIGPNHSEVFRANRYNLVPTFTCLLFLSVLSTINIDQKPEIYEKFMENSTVLERFLKKSY